MDEVAAFVFANEAESYAARTGRPDNVGVVGVAVFREKRHVQPWREGRIAPAPASPSAQRDSYAGGAAKAESARAPEVSAAAPGMRAEPDRSNQSRLGTAHGER